MQLKRSELLVFLFCLIVCAPTLRHFYLFADEGAIFNGHNFKQVHFSDLLDTAQAYYSYTGRPLSNIIYHLYDFLLRINVNGVFPLRLLTIFLLAAVGVFFYRLLLRCGAKQRGALLATLALLLQQGFFISPAYFLISTHLVGMIFSLFIAGSYIDKCNRKELLGARELTLISVSCWITLLLYQPVLLLCFSIITFYAITSSPTEVVMRNQKLTLAMVGLNAALYTVIYKLVGLNESSYHRARSLFAGLRSQSVEFFIDPQNLHKYLQFFELWNFPMDRATGALVFIFLLCLSSLLIYRDLRQAHDRLISVKIWFLSAICVLLSFATLALDRFSERQQSLPSGQAMVVCLLFAAITKIKFNNNWINRGALMLTVFYLLVNAIGAYRTLSENIVGPAVAMGNFIVHQARQSHLESIDEINVIVDRRPFDERPFCRQEPCKGLFNRFTLGRYHATGRNLYYSHLIRAGFGGKMEIVSTEDAPPVKGNLLTIDWNLF